MNFAENLQSILEPIVDFWYHIRPFPKPGPETYQHTRIVAHRGDHKNYRENTMNAFRSCEQMGVFGIEFDIQWTKDLIAVVHHDPNTLRTFPDHSRITIKDVNFSELRQQLPEIPTLTEVVEAFSNKLHFMIELKTQDHFNPSDYEMANLHLQQALGPLKPQSDFHFMSFHMKNFSMVKWSPKKCWLPIAELNIASTLNRVIQDKLGGITCHHLLLTTSQRHQLLKNGLQWGTGFPTSINALRKEMHRATPWVFTNHPDRLQRELN